MDYDFWISQHTKEVIEAEGNILIDYRPLQKACR